MFAETHSPVEDEQLPAIRGQQGKSAGLQQGMQSQPLMGLLKRSIIEHIQRSAMRSGNPDLLYPPPPHATGLPSNEPAAVVRREGRGRFAQPVQGITRALLFKTPLQAQEAS